MDVSSKYEQGYEFGDEHFDDLKEVRELDDASFLAREQPSFFEDKIQTLCLNIFDKIETGSSTIAKCFSSCFSCRKEVLLEKTTLMGNVETSCVEIALKTWLNPKPHGQSKHKEGEWVRGHFLLFAGLAVLNSVTKVIFTVISLVPGSSSKSVSNSLVIDNWANEGLFKKVGAQSILPFLFALVAVTINPFAKMDRVLNRVNCFSNFIFKEAIRNAKAGMGACIGGMRYSSKSGIKEMLQRNVISRFLFLTATVLLVVEKVSHLAIGLILAGCAFATLFRDENLNNLARNYLGSLDVVDVVCVGLRAVFYPWQDLGRDDNLSYYRDLIDDTVDR